MFVRRSLSWAATGALMLLAGCLPPQGSEDAWPAPASFHTPGYGWPPSVEEGRPGAVRQGTWASAPRASDDAVSRDATTATATRPSIAQGPLPGGDECLQELKARGLSFEPLAEVRGVALPVILKGPVGGVEYWANDGRPLLVDCKLGIALHRIGPLLRHHGVARVRFSGSYVYRTTRTGKLSLHAHGLAIDIHDVHASDELLTVKQHFSRGAGCGPSVPVLNRLACDLETLGIFRELLTPDYNRDHHDHFHLAVPRSL